MPRRRVLPVLLLVLGLLAGCGDQTSSPSTGAGASGSPSASPATPTGSPTGSPTAQAFPRDRVQVGNLHVAVLDSTTATSRQEQAVVDAWMEFWKGAADTQYLQRATPQFLSVARGTARTELLDYMARAKARHERVVGWSRDNVTAVHVHGVRATVRDCVENFTFTVDHEGEPITRPTPFLAVTGRLEKAQGRWTVVDQTTKQLTEDCRT